MKNTELDKPIKGIRLLLTYLATMQTGLGIGIWLFREYLNTAQTRGFGVLMVFIMAVGAFYLLKYIELLFQKYGRCN